MIWKLVYALGAGLLSVWVVSFAPAEGPPIAPYLPADAGAVLQFRSGTEFLRALWENDSLQEFLNDPDVNAMWAPLAKREQALEKLKQAPAIVRRLFPPTLATTLPLVGHECAVTFAGPSRKEAGGASVLFFTRLSGSRGHLLRLAARFAKLPRGVRYFDLGGGLAALGLGGAEPEQGSASQPSRARQQAVPDRSLTVAARNSAGEGEGENGSGSSEGHALFLARLTILPPGLSAGRGQPASATQQYAQLRDGGLPESVLNALLKPPGVPEMCNLSKPPGGICLDFFATPAGGFLARGRLQGVTLPMPATSAIATAGSEVFAEALVPVDVRACFLSYLESEMRLSRDDSAVREDGASSTRGQRRWSHRFSELAAAGVDLDRDLWPALGHTLLLSIGPDPLDVAGYALLRGSISFDGSKSEARDAAAELIRQRWDGALFDGPVPPNEKPPYVKQTRDERCDKYLLNTGRLLVPAWIISRHMLSLTSNAGPGAFRNPAALREPQTAETEGAGVTAEARAAAAAGGSYFLRLDGPRLAPTVERITTLVYDEMEDSMKSGDFLARYPDAGLNIRLAARIACLLGRLSLVVRPETGKDAATVELAWTPGTPVH